MEYYKELCEQEGTAGLRDDARGQDFAHHWIAEDPDKAWAEIGHHLFHEARTYHAWQTDDIKSAVHSHATDARGAARRGHLHASSRRTRRIAKAKAGPTFIVRLPPAVRWHADRPRLGDPPDLRRQGHARAVGLAALAPPTGLRWQRWLYLWGITVRLNGAR